MLSRPLLNRIVANEALVRGLGDAEARCMIEWLVDRGDELSLRHDETSLSSVLDQLCRRARAIGCFVRLWCHDQSRGAAAQLAAVERFTWPLPSPATDPCLLMENALHWEWAQFRPQLDDGPVNVGK